jgi:hypothetical protein
MYQGVHAPSALLRRRQPDLRRDAYLQLPPHRDLLLGVQRPSGALRVRLTG